MSESEPSHAVKFPEYQYIEFVTGSYENRNTIIGLSQVNQYLANAQKSSCWISHFRFTDFFPKFVTKRKSVAGYPGSCYSSYLWFDIDVKGKEGIDTEALARALTKAQALIGRLLHNYDLRGDYLRCYFSGSKGFHVGIPMEVFALEPCKDFNQKCKHLALSIAGDLGFDESLYDKTRLFRLPNTRHSKSSLYKVELSANEIAECSDINTIINLAKGKRDFRAERLDPDEIAGDLAHLMETYQQAQPGERKQRRKAQTDHDYAGILAGKLEGESRTQNLVILAGHWYSRGISLDEAIEMGKSWDTANDLGLDTDQQYKNKYPIGKVAGTIEDIYRRNDQGGTDGIIEYKQLSELEHKEFAPIKWIAEPYIPEGLTLFVGKPKLGKSWLMLNLALAVACGGVFLNSIRVDPGAVLYLDLDGNERRLKRRAEKILQGESFPGGFYYEHRHSRGEMGVKRITNWLEGHEDARLIVIDTFVKFRDLSGAKNINIYEKDTQDLAILEKLADEYQVGIICVHHARKAASDDILDMASGSTGMSGGVNTSVTMKKDRTKSDAVLSITGHDIEEGELEIAVDFDSVTGMWALLGNAAEYRLSQQRQEILNILKTSKEAMTPREIAKELGKNPSTIRTLVQKLVEDGYIQDYNRSGSYILIRSIDSVDSVDSIDGVDGVDGQELF